MTSAGLALEAVGSDPKALLRAVEEAGWDADALLALLEERQAPEPRRQRRDRQGGRDRKHDEEALQDREAELRREAEARIQPETLEARLAEVEKAVIAASDACPGALAGRLKLSEVWQDLAGLVEQGEGLDERTRRAVADGLDDLERTAEVTRDLCATGADVVAWGLSHGWSKPGTVASLTGRLAAALDPEDFDPARFATSAGSSRRRATRGRT